MEEIYRSPQFRRVVLGAVLVAADECGFRKTKKLDLFYWASESLDNKTVAELEEIYNEYARNDFKKKG